MPWSLLHRQDPPPFLLPFSLWKEMLMFRDREWMLFQSSSLGVIWAVSSLLMHQLILGQIIPTSDLLLKCVETYNEEMNLPLLRVLNSLGENKKTIFYTNGKLKGLEYPAHFKTALMVDC